MARESPDCLSDEAIDRAVGAAVRSGAATIDMRALPDLPLCSGLTPAQQVQRIRAAAFPEDAARAEAERQERIAREAAEAQAFEDRISAAKVKAAPAPADDAVQPLLARPVEQFRPFPAPAGRPRPARQQARAASAAPARARRPPLGFFPVWGKTSRK